MCAEAICHVLFSLLRLYWVFDIGDTSATPVKLRIEEWEERLFYKYNGYIAIHSFLKPFRIYHFLKITIMNNTLTQSVASGCHKTRKKHDYLPIVSIIFRTPRECDFSPLTAISATFPFFKACKGQHNVLCIFLNNHSNSQQKTCSSFLTSTTHAIQNQQEVRRERLIFLWS